MSKKEAPSEKKGAPSGARHDRHDQGTGRRAGEHAQHHDVPGSRDQPVPRTLAIAASLAVSTLASIGLMVVYIAGGQPQVEGLLIGAALGGLALGMILWAHRLLPEGSEVEDRKPHASPDDTRRLFEGEVDARTDEIRRRTFLTRLLVAAGGALGLAALFPIASFGRGPGSALRRTSWRSGALVVGEDGRIVTRNTLAVGGVLTVFPEGAEGSADSATVLIRLDPEEVEPLSGADEWTPEGYVAFSKICTHAGCPVGLYQAATHELFCPCHQSVFDVLDGARPTAGPATRPLPQLPLRIDDATGELRARGDFPEPVGPAFWELG